MHSILVLMGVRTVSNKCLPKEEEREDSVHASSFKKKNNHPQITKSLFKYALFWQEQGDFGDALTLPREQRCRACKRLGFEEKDGRKMKICFKHFCSVARELKLSYFFSVLNKCICLMGSHAYYA